METEINRLEAEVSGLVPFELDPEDPELQGIVVRVEPIFGFADQKAENEKKKNKSQKQCPKCGLLPKDYKSKGQDPLPGEEGYCDHTFCPNSLFDLTSKVGGRYTKICISNFRPLENGF